MGSIWIIGGTARKVIPNLAVAIKSPITKTSEGDIVTTEKKCSRLVLVTNWHGIVEPISCICTPLDSYEISQTGT